MMPRAMARKPRHPEKLENACRTANMQHISVPAGRFACVAVGRKADAAARFRSRLAPGRIATTGTGNREQIKPIRGCKGSDRARKLRRAPVRPELNVL